MDVDTVVAEAQERANVEKIHDHSFREGLERYAEAVSAQERLTDRGRWTIHRRAVASLANRLAVDDYVARHPETLEDPVERPLVVLGMPRTGTSLVINLLAQVRGHRPILNWEALATVPPPRAESYDRDPRLLTRRQELRSIEGASALAVKHWEEADDPTECTIVHEQDFKSLILETFVADPTYADWLLAVDVSSAYRYEQRLLQVLQSSVRGRWLLKMPSHALHLEDLFSVFPDADVVVCHRDPVAALASACSQRASFQALLFDSVDVDLVRSTSTKLLLEHCTRPMRWRDAHGNARFYDLSYTSLVADPITEMRSIVEHFGGECSSESVRNMGRLLGERPADSRGRHSYTLEEYGIDRSEVESLFADYIWRHAPFRDDGAR